MFKVCSFLGKIHRSEVKLKAVLDANRQGKNFKQKKKLKVQNRRLVK